jgi:uncharacterized membrane protein YsdA (DUF1294 family)
MRFMTDIAYYLILVNLLAAGLMAWDKYCAMRRRWRVPEATLFSVAMMGGSPTMFMVIRYLRHKSRKTSFLWRLNVILLVQVALFAAFGVINFG